MIVAMSLLLGAVLVGAAWLYFVGTSRARDAMLRDIKQAPTPEQARIEVESKERVEQIDQAAEKEKANVSGQSGEDLRRTFVDRLFRRE